MCTVNAQNGAMTVREALPDMICGGELYRDDVNKISFVLHVYQACLDAAAAFPELKAENWGGNGETAPFGDLGAKNISKVYAIDVLLAHLGAERADTIAFGDANVDIPMMEYCAYGVALGSSGAKIRSKADLVTDGVGQKSLWNVFCKLGLVDKN